MRVTVSVADPQHHDDGPARELGRWLGEAEQLRGRIRLVEGLRQTGALNETILTLVAELGPPGIAAFGAAVITWLRHRRSDTRVTVRRPDGARFEITARRVRGLGPAEVRALVDQLSSALDERPPAA